MDDGFRVVRVDMENRRRDDLGDVRAIGRRPGIFRRRGEADLVVDDDVDGAAGLIADQVGEIEGFGHQALSGKGRVAVQQQRHHLIPVGVVPLQLLAAHFS